METEKCEKKVFVCDNPKCSGLGNRIINLFSLLRQYARGGGVNEIFYVWPNTGWVTAKFHELFQFNFPIKINEVASIDSIPPASFIATPTWQFWLEESDGVDASFAVNPAGYKKWI